MDLKYILGDDGKRAFHDTVACVHELIHSAREAHELHAELVLNSCVVTANVVREIASIDYAPLAYGLCRSVLELAAGTSYLALHPECCTDFQTYGKWAHCEIAKTFDPPPFDPLPDQDALGQYFKNKSGIPTWHKLTQDKLVSSMIEGARPLKRNASAFLHGDALMSLSAVSHTPGGGWSLSLFRPMILDHRVPIEMAIATFADLLVHVNDLLSLGRTDVVRRLHDNMQALCLPGYF